MDPRYSGQDILLCDLCQTDALQSHCELCQINLCKACVGEHLSDSSQRHKVVPYKYRTSAANYPKCPSHIEKQCELYCEKCDTPVCSTCISSGQHHGHKLIDALHKISSKIEDLKRDLKELEQRIHPTYEKIASDIKSKKEILEIHYKKQMAAVTKQGEDWHREINIIVNKRKSDIDEMKTKHLAALNKQENEIKQKIPELIQSILDLKNLLDFSNVSQTFAYQSRNAKLRSLPPKFNVSLPSFSPHQINTEQLLQMFGSLSPLSIITEEHGYTMETPEAISCPPVKSLLDKPELITTIDTGLLHSVTSLSDEEIWTLGNSRVMKLFNLQGKLLKSIESKSGNDPRDIAVTKSGDLVYTDPDKRTVNIVRNKHIQEVIRLQGWRPLCICNTSSGDFLVSMGSDDKHLRVVRYSGSAEKQSIQFDSEGQPLYSYAKFTKYMYISENRNLDICVADCEARAVVVVNQVGKLRFRYTGHSTTKKSFKPLAITTDSHGQILTTDHYDHCIHILDQDGQFLCYINNYNLEYPSGICVDTRDNIFVGELIRGKVRKIKYM